MTPNTAFFGVRGVVEGFYGPPYTFPERDDLIAWLGCHGFNFYLYGPKNDRQHRMRWREPYPAPTMAQFANTVRLAKMAGVRFCYALSPAVSMVYADPSDFECIVAKLGAFYECGVRDFSLFCDDMDAELKHPLDRAAYSSFAHAHSDLAKRVHTWLRQLDPACTLSLCPTDYAGVAPFSRYLHELGERLDPAIDVFYTGPETCAPTITAADAAAFAQVVRRRPLIWDNYPVNDLTMQPELHIGPVRGRSPDLHIAVAGLLANPMLQPEASKVPLNTIGDYLADPYGYEPERAWDRALAEAAGEESVWALRHFAACSLHSALGTPEAIELAQFAEAAMAALRAGASVSSPTVRALHAHLVALDEASYHLKNRMSNLALRRELLPWLDLLDQWCNASWSAMRVLEALEAGKPQRGLINQIRELLEGARRHHKRFGGRVLEPLAEHALTAIL